MKLDHPSLFKTDAYINGQWQSAASGATFAVLNPATGETVAEIADCGAAEATRSVEAAQQAMESWRRTSAKQRGDLLREWARLMREHQNDLATLLTLEQGKPLAEALGEITIGIQFTEWFAEEGKRAYGRIIPPPSQDKRLLINKEPVGVCAQITPWNFPSAMVTRKAAPALAAGCTVVCKPSELTPLSALALVALAEEAGFPPGVLNFVPGSNAAAIGEVYTSHPQVKHLSFTGSTAVGKKLMAQCASTVKQVALELGGNAPYIVFDDADIDIAIKGVMASKFRNAGQTCISVNRILAQDGIYDQFVERLCEATAALSVGDGLQGAFDQGPLIEEKAAVSVESLLADAVGKGADVRLGGKRHALGQTFFEPTVVAGATQDMRVAREEIFGPVAPVYRFTEEDEAVAMANATEYGLAAFFYSRDNARIFRVMDKLEYGMIGVNEIAMSNELTPFGGVKESGIGREGGIEGLEEYLETKLVCIGGLE